MEKHEMIIKSKIKSETCILTFSSRHKHKPEFVRSY